MQDHTQRPGPHLGSLPFPASSRPGLHLLRGCEKTLKGGYLKGGVSPPKVPGDPYGALFSALGHDLSSLWPHLPPLPSKTRFHWAHPEPARADPPPGWFSVGLPVTVSSARALNLLLRPAGWHRSLREVPRADPELAALAFLEGGRGCLVLFSNVDPTTPHPAAARRGLCTDCLTPSPACVVGKGRRGMRPGSAPEGGEPGLGLEGVASTPSRWDPRAGPASDL